MTQGPPPPGPPSAPPPGAGPPPSGAASAPFTITGAIGYAWTAYRKNLRPMLLIALVMFALGPAYRLVDLVIGSQVPAGLIWLLSQIVGTLFALGMTRATLAVTHGREPRVSMLFEIDRFGSYLVATTLFYIGTIIGFVALVIPGIIFAMLFWFYNYVIVDQAETSPIEALKWSARLVSGRFWLVVRLGVVLLLLLVPGVVLYGIGLAVTEGVTNFVLRQAYWALSIIGLLFTFGLIHIAWAYAYRALSGEPVAPAR